MDNYKSRLGNFAVHGDVPLNAGYFSHPLIEKERYKHLLRTLTMNPYSSRSNSMSKLPPSSVLENIGPTTPLKLNMQEETLVIDAVPVESSCGGSSSASSHSRRPAYRTLEDSVSSFPVFKSRLTRGKEERHLSRLSVKDNSSEADVVEFPRLQAPKYKAALPSRPAPQLHKPPGIRIPTRDWSPLDDGILVDSPSLTGEGPSRKDVDAQIHRFLHGPRATKRLPVFINLTDP